MECICKDLPKKAREELLRYKAEYEGWKIMRTLSKMPKRKLNKIFKIVAKKISNK